ncbi:MAG: PcfK-like family protein [Clostridia bacterium]|nr:PcfK-like family protein [Clostridia bacterium]
MKINLEAKDESQKRILEYLEENASEILVNKINNGVQVEKDGKQLLSKKDLDSFFIYATNEAKKMAENKSYACIDDKTVFSWAIHYFEEDEIQGKLFNIDGTEFEPPKPIKKETPKVEVKEKPKQPSLFDFITEPEKEECQDEEIEEEIEEEIPPMKEIAGRKVDTSTGEVISNNNETFDKYILKTIAVILDGKVKFQ